MAQGWKHLTDLTQNKAFLVERVRLVDQDIAIEGSFELPPIARLGNEDQVFIAAFLKTHGSIKEMERLFGVSYPTIKNRLSRIGELLEFVVSDPPPTQSEVLELLSRGEISAGEALERLKK